MSEIDTKKEGRNITEFKKAINGMVATSSNSYLRDSAYRRGLSHKPYTKEEVETILEAGNSDSLREVSLTFFYTSGFYRRFLIYYATMLKYTSVLIPHLSDTSESLSNKKYSKQYSSALNFMDGLKLNKLGQRIALKVLVEGAFYGLLKEYPDGAISIQDLPFAYCRSRFKNQNEVDIVELNLKYFDTITDKKLRDDCLKNYPIEVKRAYNSFKNKGTSNWFFLEPGIGLYFNLVEEKPFMLNVIPSVINFSDYQEIEKKKDLQDIKKLLVQYLPLDDNYELTFEPEEMEEIHRGTIEMLKKNDDIDVLTSYAEIKLEDMQNSRSVISNNLEKIEKTIYSEAGVSKELFAADGNIALEKSIQNDLSMMMMLANDISNWMEYCINERFGNNKIKFKTSILPVTFYNEKDFQASSVLLAQYGYSFTIPFLSLGLRQSDLLDIKKLEVELLNLADLMTPLKSSATSTGEEGSTGGATELPDDKKSDKTIQNGEA